VHDEQAAARARQPQQKPGWPFPRLKAQSARPRPLQLAPDCPASERTDPAAPAGLHERLDVMAQRLEHSGRTSAGSRQATSGRFAALAILHASGPLRVGDLAARAGAALPAISQIIDRTVRCGRAGGAARRAGETDHRARVISIHRGRRGDPRCGTARQDRAWPLAQRY
jgi:hypothetical protein